MNPIDVRIDLRRYSRSLRGRVPAHTIAQHHALSRYDRLENLIGRLLETARRVFPKVLVDSNKDIDQLWFSMTFYHLAENYPVPKYSNLKRSLIKQELGLVLIHFPEFVFSWTGQDHLTLHVKESSKESK